MPYVWMESRKPPSVYADVGILWTQVARRRRLDGDLEGASRASWASNQARPLSARRRFLYVGLGVVHLAHPLQNPACGYARPGSGASHDPGDVTCGNCVRTKIYKKMRWEAA